MARGGMGHGAPDDRACVLRHPVMSSIGAATPLPSARLAGTPLPTAAASPVGPPPPRTPPADPAAGAKADVDTVLAAAKHGGRKGLKYGALGGLGVGAAVALGMLVIAGPAGLLAGGATAGMLALRYGLLAGGAGAALGAGVAMLRSAP